MKKFNMLVLTFGLTIFLGTNEAIAERAYELPVGVPDPISTWIPDGYSGDVADITHPIWGEAPASWEAAKTDGLPAYYIDNTDPKATDKNNAFGSPDLPRMSIPEINIVYEEGSYVEIHGGPYSGGGQLILTAYGTVEKPVWFRGESAENMPEITGQTIVKGQYVFFENLKYTEQYMSIQLRSHQESSVHHVVVRNCIMQGQGVFAGKNSSAITAYGASSDNRFHDFVIYNNEISYFGDSFSDSDPGGDDLTSENDYHGIGVPSNVDRVWVLKNHIHHLGGDSIQVGTASTDDENRVSDVYIANNNFHDNLENGVDVKEADNTLVIDNDMYNFIWHNGNNSTGDPVVVHDNAYNTWIVNNRIYDSGRGIIHTGGLDVWIVGNVIKNIKHPAWTEDFGTGIHVRGNSSGGVVNNTIVNTDQGITTTSGTYLFANNIIYNRNEEMGYDIQISTTTSSNIVAHNLMYHPTYTANLKNVTCTDCLYSDPSFVDEEYQTSNNSPVLDSGYPLLVLQKKFKATFGEDFDEDMLGNPRVNGSIDIGAIENTYSTLEGKVVTIPSPPVPKNVEMLFQ